MSTELSVDFAGVRLENPIILASATPGWDGRHCLMAAQAGAGAIVPKTIGPPMRWAQHPRCGRMKLVKFGRRRIGMVNIELYTTMPMEKWLETELKIASSGGAKIIASIVANPDPADTVKICKAVEATGCVSLIEINVSCPMPAGEDRVGFQMGNDPDLVSRQVAALKKAASLPCGVKMTPTAHNLVPIARAAEKAGADFLTISNSIRSFAGVDIYSGRPKLAAYGGYSGPAIKPVVQRHVSEVAAAVKIPISACGGISTWEDVVEYIMLGATTVQVCTAVMWEGTGKFGELKQGLADFMRRQGYKSLDDFRGISLPHIKPIDELAKLPRLVARVDPLKCTDILKGGGCKICGTVCFYDAIAFDPRMRIMEENCDGCGLCVEFCPTEALVMAPPASSR